MERNSALRLISLMWAEYLLRHISNISKYWHTWKILPSGSFWIEYSSFLCFQNCSAGPVFLVLTCIDGGNFPNIEYFLFLLDCQTIHTYLDHAFNLKCYKRYENDCSNLMYHINFCMWKYCIFLLLKLVLKGKRYFLSKLHQSDRKCRTIDFVTDTAPSR